MIGPRPTIWHPGWEAVDRIMARVEAICSHRKNCKIVADEQEVMKVLGLGVMVRAVLRAAGFVNPTARCWTRGDGAEVSLF